RGAIDALIENAVEHGKETAGRAAPARRAGDDQMLARAGHGDVEQALLLFGASAAGFLRDVNRGETGERADAHAGETRRPVEERLAVGAAAGFDARLAARKNHHGKLEALG